MPCECCNITNDQFDESSAQGDLKYYQKRGPAKQTRLILDAVRSLGLKDATLLDVGGGIGTIHHELLGQSAKKAIHVDASQAYLNTARAESARRGNDGRVEFIHADFTDVAPDLPQVDVVTLDRVVCCYPNFQRLLTSASGRSQKALVMTYPRESLLLRFGMLIFNSLQALFGRKFRIFLHSIKKMDTLLNEQGFKRTSRRRLLIWEMALYQRA